MFLNNPWLSIYLIYLYIIYLSIYLSLFYILLYFVYRSYGRFALCTRRLHYLFNWVCFGRLLVEFDFLTWNCEHKDKHGFRLFLPDLILWWNKKNCINNKTNLIKVVGKIFGIKNSLNGLNIAHINFQPYQMASSIHLVPGVYIIQIIEIFAPTPFIKWYFFPMYSENFLFSPFFYIRIFSW